MTSARTYATGYVAVWPRATGLAALVVVVMTIMGAQLLGRGVVETALLAPAELLMVFGLKFMIVGFLHDRLFAYPRRLELVVLMVGLTGAAALLFALPTLLAVAQPNQT